MKSLKEYLIESEQTYVYKVKIAGDLDKKVLASFKLALEKFQPIKITKPKRIPIEKDPVGFPGLKNQEVHIFDITLRYPAATQQVQEMARTVGIEHKNIIVLDKNFNDSYIVDLVGIEPADTVKLETEFPDQTKEQKKASDDYADSYKDIAKGLGNGDTSEFTIAGSDVAKNATIDDNIGKESPFSNIIRPTVKDLIK